jgi:hypothetical protein
VTSLKERLAAVESDPIGCGLARSWHRNPDGPEALALIEELEAALIRIRDHDGVSYRFGDEVREIARQALGDTTK